MKSPLGRIGIDRLLFLGLSHREANFAIEYSKDWDARRAAAACGWAPDTGYQVREREDVQMALDLILQERLNDSHIDAEWLLYELVDNHTIARATGKLTASNTALGLIGKMGTVDAFAAEKVIMASDQDVVDRLNRARQRTAPVEDPPKPPPVSFF